MWFILIRTFWSAKASVCGPAKCATHVRPKDSAGHGENDHRTQSGWELSTRQLESMPKTGTTSANVFGIHLSMYSGPGTGDAAREIEHFACKRCHSAGVLFVRDAERGRVSCNVVAPCMGC